MKTATNKALPGSQLKRGHILLCFRALLLVMTCIWAGNVFGAPGELSTDSLPPRNRHFFLVRLEQGIANGQDEQVRNAFLNHGFTDCELQPSSKSIRLICEKGCTLERVQEVLKELDLTLNAYQEAYTNQTPVFFR